MIMFIYAIVSAFAYLLGAGVGIESDKLVAAMRVSGSTTREVFVIVAVAVFVVDISTQVIWSPIIRWKRPTLADIRASLLRTLVISMWLALLVVSGILSDKHDSTPTVYTLSFAAGVTMSFWFFLTLMNIIKRVAPR